MIHITGYEHLQHLKDTNMIGEELQAYLQDLIWQRYDLENNEDWYDMEELTEKRKNGTLEVDKEYFKIVLITDDDDTSDLPSFDGFCGGSLIDTVFQLECECRTCIIKDEIRYYDITFANTDDIVDIIVSVNNYFDCIMFDEWFTEDGLHLK